MNFPSNENAIQVNVNYHSKIVNYVLLSLLDVYNSLDSFAEDEIVSLIKFVDEYGFSNKHDIMNKCTKRIDQNINKFIDAIIVEDTELFEPIRNKILEHLETEILYGYDIKVLQDKLSHIKDYSEELQEINCLDKCLNQVLPIFGNLLAKRIFGIKKFKAKCADANTIVISYANNVDYDRLDSHGLHIGITVAKILNKIFGYEDNLDHTTLENDTQAIINYYHNVTVMEPNNIDFNFMEKQYDESISGDYMIEPFE